MTHYLQKHGNWIGASVMLALAACMAWAYVVAGEPGAFLGAIAFGFIAGVTYWQAWKSRQEPKPHQARKGSHPPALPKHGPACTWERLSQISVLLTLVCLAFFMFALPWFQFFSTIYLFAIDAGTIGLGVSLLLTAVGGIGWAVTRLLLR